jgi:hypothetical protein
MLDHLVDRAAAEWDSLSGGINISQCRLVDVIERDGKGVFRVRRLGRRHEQLVFANLDDPSLKADAVTKGKQVTLAEFAESLELFAQERDGSVVF